MSRARAVIEACQKTATPRLLAMLCVLSVFIPSLFMVGVGRQLFVPLSLAVGFAMISSYVLSSTLVPVLSTWMLRAGHGARAARSSSKLRSWYRDRLESVLGVRWLVVGGYVVGGGRVDCSILLPAHRHRDLSRGRNQAAPAPPARPDRHAARAHRADRAEGDGRHQERSSDRENVEITTGFIGVQTPNYPINTIYLFASGQHEAVLGVSLKPSAPPVTESLKERTASRAEEGVARRGGVIRGGRHHQPGHELRLADADRSGRAGAGAGRRRARSPRRSVRSW